MRFFVTGFGVVLVVATALVVSYYVGIFGNHLKANYARRVVTSEVQQNVRTADFAQQVYEQFFNDCNAVVADNTKIDIAKERVASVEGQPDDAFGTKAAKVSDAVSDLAGLRQSQADTAARYNAAAAEYTRGQFLSNDLPSQLDEPYMTVTCGGRP